jgi:hypothetical protein
MRCLQTLNRFLRKALLAAGIWVGAGVLCADAQVPAARQPAKPFAIRGIKGLWWEGIDKYRLALPWLAKNDLNFLMLCYSSFAASGREWRSDYTPAEQKQLRELAAEAKRHNIRLCLSFNPGIWSQPPLTHSSETDYQHAWRKVRTMHALGIHWFALCLDDIRRELPPADQERFGTLQAAQVYFVNRLWSDMKTLSPRPKLIFCPSAYTTDDARQHPDYIQAVGEGLDREIEIFWTGPQVCSPRITASGAREFGRWIRRKPFVWDNYPVNDMFPWRPLLAPVRHRSADLSGEVSGYLANPMKQWHISCLPLKTLALYLTAPDRYQPSQALESALIQYPADQRPALRLLLKLYGSSFWGDAGFPPQPRPANQKEAARLLSDYRKLREMLKHRGLKPIRQDVLPTLEEDIRRLERKARDRLRETPLHAFGDDFEGGAGQVFGFFKYNHPVNYVYARSTGRDMMRVDLVLSELPADRAVLRLKARDDDSHRKLKIRIVLNGFTIIAGDSPFHSRDFSTLPFPVPSSALRVGRNTLMIQNLEPEGPLGMPPWFMVAEAEIVWK